MGQVEAISQLRPNSLFAMETVDHNASLPDVCQLEQHVPIHDVPKPVVLKHQIWIADAQAWQLLLS